ncbi:hypothetical protein GCM10022276_14020 [Sphingomonas limnosediminicola]|uniref:Calcium-binding protein n=1 Tax=Sphingomonas limnosediminicola TaxID=940133 RepID=A0ABP7L8R3_9SPHN
MPTITGTEGTDVLSGGADADTILGLGGNDFLTGNEGNDVIDGGSGDDTITGSSGADILTGGSGVDVFRDKAAGLNGDRITDFLPGDRIQITDLNIQTATIGLNGSTITFNGNSLTVDNLGPGRLVVRGMQEGGVEIRLQGVAHNDFDGDGISDFMWRDASGTMSEWTGTKSGGFQWNSSTSFAVGNDWTMLGFGDFTGDGHNDILWRQTSTGMVQEWASIDNGGAGSFAWKVDYNLPTTQQFQTIGDFNGDGRQDVMWRTTDGTLSEWLGQVGGGFQWNPYSAFNVTNDWKVIGSGDFNNDGHDDLLWRQDNSGIVMEWLGNDQGSFAWNVNFDLPTSYHLVGTGDFNSDGVSDIMWRNSDGRLSEWLGQGNGGFQWNPNASFAVSNDWQAAGIGDYNGDGLDDIMWQTSTGHVYQWLGQLNGNVSTFAWNQAVQYDVGTNFHAQPPSDHFL